MGKRKHSEYCIQTVSECIPLVFKEDIIRDILPDDLCTIICDYAEETIEDTFDLCMAITHGMTVYLGSEEGNIVSIKPYMADDKRPGYQTYTVCLYNLVDNFQIHYPVHHETLFLTGWMNTLLSFAMFFPWKFYFYASLRKLQQELFAVNKDPLDMNQRFMKKKRMDLNSLVTMSGFIRWCEE